MKRASFLVITIFLLAVSVPAQTPMAQAKDAPKRIALTPRSTVPIALLAKGVDEKCFNVVLTSDASKADYLLEAATIERLSVYKGTGGSSVRTEFTLFSQNGDVLFHTSTRFYENGMKDICTSIGLGIDDIVKHHKIMLGMSPKQVRASRGEPKDIRKLDPSSSDQREVWEYKDQHVFFEHGVVTGWSP
jgi:hypothetical protein